MAEDIVGSKMPTFASDALKSAGAGYGQNGYAGPSSDNPGKNTKSGFLPDPGVPTNSQMRTLPSGNVPDAFGMKRQTKPVNAGA